MYTYILIYIYIYTHYVSICQPNFVIIFIKYNNLLICMFVLPSNWLMDFLIFLAHPSQCKSSLRTTVTGPASGFFAPPASAGFFSAASFLVSSFCKTICETKDVKF
ncbi:hypothetical protein Hanom_Chr07g00664511 [Helianthus anomalus]